MAHRHRACALFAALISVAAPVDPASAADQIHWTITGQGSVTFDWRGTADEKAISYGTSPGEYGHEVIGQTPSPLPTSSPGPFFEAKLTGLQEDTLYYYSIAGGPEHSFRTPPPRGAADFEIVVLGDVGNSRVHSRVPVVQHMVAELQPRFVLVPGDMAYAQDAEQDGVDQHFNDVMDWSRDAAYMPAWGNHEWQYEAIDDLRNYKGRFDLPNPQSSPGAPALGCCGEDWYWFDYGNARFIAYPEPYPGGRAWADWGKRVRTIMDEAQADPAIDFIVTFGHRPSFYSSMLSARPTWRRVVDFIATLLDHPIANNSTLSDYRALLDIMEGLAVDHDKYVLNVFGHKHAYERSHLQNGIVHIDVGTGGHSLTEEPGCGWAVCPAPSWSAFRALRLGALKLHFTDSRIEGSFICGPAGGGRNFDDCSPGEAMDVFTIEPRQELLSTAESETPVSSEADPDRAAPPVPD